MKLKYRQGDVLIWSCDDSEFERQLKDAEPKQLNANGDAVVALGERTGHSHRVTRLARGARAFRKTIPTGEAHLFDFVGRGHRIDHEEHAAIDLPPGKYKMTIQRQYVAGRVRNVAD